MPEEYVSKYRKNRYKSEKQGESLRFLAKNPYICEYDYIEFVFAAQPSRFISIESDRRSDRKEMISAVLFAYDKLSGINVLKIPPPENRPLTGVYGPFGIPHE